MSQISDKSLSSVTTSSLSLNNVTQSPQMAFACLQMKLAEANKLEAMNGIKGIEAEQAKKAELAEYLNKARDYRGSSERYTKDAGGKPYTSKEFNDYVEKKLGLSVPNTPRDTDKNKAEWDKLIQQMQTKMDTMGSDIQTKMVVLQDMMGQYNSYLQGANSAISTSNQVLSSLARGQ